MSLPVYASMHAHAWSDHSHAYVRFISSPYRRASGYGARAGYVNRPVALTPHFHADTRERDRTDLAVLRGIAVVEG